MATRRNNRRRSPGETKYDNSPRSVKAFVMGRGQGGRPVLQHMTRDLVTSVCGRDLSFMGTRYHMPKPIYALLCKKCGKIEHIDIDAGIATQNARA